MRALLSIVLLAISAASNAALAPKVTDDNNGPVPEFSIKPLNAEKEIASKDLKGKPVIISFFASWCPPCHRQIKELKQIYKEFSPKGLNIIGAAADAKLVVETKPDDELK